MNIQIQDTIEFNNNLMKALCESEDEEEELCLISGDTLEKDHIKLLCKHTFNYKAILDEIKIQKKKHSILETHHLRLTQIKCPYCRNIQTGLLPWRLGYPQIKFVNWPPIKAFKGYSCSCLLKSGKRKGLPCGKKSIEKYCPRHLKTKQLEVKKNLKITKKQDVNKVNKIITSNVDVTGCQGILKTGKRKGEKCGAQIKIYNAISNSNTPSIKVGYCKRHAKKGSNIKIISEIINQIITPILP